MKRFDVAARLVFRYPSDVRIEKRVILRRSIGPWTRRDCRGARGEWALTIVYVVVTLQMRSRAHPLRGKGLSHLVVVEPEVGLSSARYSGRRAIKKEALCHTSYLRILTLNT